MVRLGIVGYGERISYLMRIFREVEPDLRVVAVVDPAVKSVRARLAECDRKDVVFYKSLKEMVRRGRLDAIAIGTRCHQHTPYAIEAAAYDLPLFLEKPVAISMAQAADLERAFESSRCRVVVSFPLRVSPLCRLAREDIAAGAVGTPEHVLAVNYVPYGTCYFDAGYRNYAITQGLFLQKATHDLDYLMYLMDAPIVRVAAMQIRGRVFGGRKPAGLVCAQCAETAACLESPQNRRRNSSGGTTADHPCVFGEDIGSPESGMNEDASSVLVEFGSGAQGVYTQVFFTRRDAATRGATVSGYHGTVAFDWYRNELRRVRHHAPFSETVKSDPGLCHFGGDTELARNFLDIIHKGAESQTPIATGLQSVYACLAAKESAEKGCFVSVRQVGGAAAGRRSRA